MRYLAILSLILLGTLAATAQGRLFLQTYGAVVPSAEGCTWNVNQDYFVPRYSSSGRYDLFSCCKHSCTSSPACKNCHPLYPGYCTNYGPLHYCWRNHLYGCRCGCEPVQAYCGPYRHGCGPKCCLRPDNCCSACATTSFCNSPANCCAEYLPNVESPEFQLLGSLSLDGDPLLTSLQLGQGMGPPAATQNSRPGLLEQTLPLLGVPSGETVPAPLPQR